MDSKNSAVDLRIRGDQLTDESLESTRRMLSYCDQSQKAGIQIIVALDEQGEQLERIEDDMNKINQDMKVAEHHLVEIEKCCGICVCPCNKTKKFKQDVRIWKASDDGKVVSAQPQAVKSGSKMVNPTATYITKITKDIREEEMDQNMGKMAIMVGNLKNMSLDIRQEIEVHNNTIGQINLMAHSNEGCINSAIDRTRDLIGTK